MSTLVYTVTGLLFWALGLHFLIESFKALHPSQDETVNSMYAAVCMFISLYLEKSK